MFNWGPNTDFNLQGSYQRFQFLEYVERGLRPDDFDLAYVIVERNFL